MKSIKILLVCVLVAGFYTTSVAFSKDKVDEIERLVEDIQDQDIQLSSWKVYILKSVQDASSEEEAMEQLENIKSLESGYQWDIEFEDNKNFIAEGYKKVDSKDIELKVKVTGNRIGSIYRMYYAYEVNSKWSVESLEYVVNQYQDQINQHEVFFTLKGNMDLKQGIELQKQAVDLLNDLNGTYIEGVSEGQFISMSAYSKDLDQNSIAANGQRINLQIGMRQDMGNQKIDVTIGTPVITDGY